MQWWGVLLMLAGALAIVYAIRTMTRPKGPGKENCMWIGFLGVGMFGLGVAAVSGLVLG